MGVDEEVVARASSLRTGTLASVVNEPPAIPELLGSGALVPN